MLLGILAFKTALRNKLENDVFSVQKYDGADVFQSYQFSAFPERANFLGQELRLQNCVAVPYWKSSCPVCSTSLQAMAIAIRKFRLSSSAQRNCAVYVVQWVLNSVTRTTKPLWEIIFAAAEDLTE